MARPTDAQVQALAEFARWAIAEGAWNGGDVDGGEIQEKAADLGIIHQIEVTEPCGDECTCAEWDDFPHQCYRFCDWLLEAGGQLTLTNEDGNG